MVAWYRVQHPVTGQVWRLRSGYVLGLEAVVVVDRGSGWHVWSRHRRYDLARVEARKVLQGAGGRLRVPPACLLVLTARKEGGGNAR